MKKIILFVFLMIQFACKKSENKPLGDPLECMEIGLGSSHELHEEFQAILDAYVGKGFPGMAAAVYTPEEGLWLGSSGKADLEANIPMAPCNSFFSGSVAKVYTVTAAMTLVEEGLLGLDDKISDYLPDVLVQNLPNAQTATIRQLMNHSAGMPDHDDEEALNTYIEENAGSLPSGIDQLSYLFDNDPLFEAGNGAEYSSAHTLTLAIILDEVIGSHHSDLVTERIIQKLGLGRNLL